MNGQISCSGRTLPENVCPVYGDDNPNCEKCNFYKNYYGGNTMEKLSRRILTVNVRDNSVDYNDVLPIIHRLAEYEASDLSPEGVKSLTQDIKALKRDLEKREEELLDCREMIVHLREELKSQQKLPKDHDYYKKRFEETSKEADSLMQDLKALKRDLEKREEELLGCRETIVDLRYKLESQQIPLNSYMCCCEVDHIEITPQDYIHSALVNLLYAVEKMGEKK